MSEAEVREGDDRRGMEGHGQRVLIRGLEVMSVIGVPEEERRAAQRLLIDVEVVPAIPFDELDDDIRRAVDYFELSRRIKAVAETGERRLIETLAADVIEAGFEDSKIDSVRVRIRKFILPDTEWVAVELTRQRPDGAASQAGRQRD